MKPLALTGVVCVFLLPHFGLATLVPKVLDLIATARRPSRRAADFGTWLLVTGGGFATLVALHIGMGDALGPFVPRKDLFSFLFESVMTGVTAGLVLFAVDRTADRKRASIAPDLLALGVQLIAIGSVFWLSDFASDPCLPPPLPAGQVSLRHPGGH